MITLSRPADWLDNAPRPNAYRFCPDDHHHVTDSDFANCPCLDFTLGPLKPDKRGHNRGRKPCTVSGCNYDRVFESAYCGEHRRQSIARNKARKGSW